MEWSFWSQTVFTKLQKGYGVVIYKDIISDEDMQELFSGRHPPLLASKTEYGLILCSISVEGVK